MVAETKRTDRLDRNYFGNGNFEFAQEGDNFSAIGTTLQYFHDMFQGQRNADFSDANVNRVKDAPASDSMLKYCQEFLFTPSAVGSAEWKIQQRVEDLFARELDGEECSTNFHYENDEFQEALIEFYAPTTTANDFSSLSLVHSTTVSLDTSKTWTELRLDEDSAFFLNGVSLGLQAQVTFRNNLTSGSQKSLKYTGFKLNKGKYAQKFSYAGRDYRDELNLVMRYWEDGIGGISDVGSAAAVLGGVDVRSFKAPKRNEPQMTILDIEGGSTGFRNDDTGATEGSPTTNIFNNSTLYVRSTTALSNDIVYSYYYIANSRL